MHGISFFTVLRDMFRFRFVRQYMCVWAMILSGYIMAGSDECGYSVYAIFWVGLFGVIIDRNWKWKKEKKIAKELLIYQGN